MSSLTFGHLSTTARLRYLMISHPGRRILESLVSDHVCHHCVLTMTEHVKSSFRGIHRPHVLWLCLRDVPTGAPFVALSVQAKVGRTYHPRRRRMGCSNISENLPYRWHLGLSLQLPTAFPQLIVSEPPQISWKHAIIILDDDYIGDSSACSNRPSPRWHFGEYHDFTDTTSTLIKISAFRVIDVSRRCPNTTINYSRHVAT